jgi:hypothetical protein
LSEEEGPLVMYNIDYIQADVKYSNMMVQHKMNTLWTRYFKNLPPIAEQVRSIKSSEWLRFHMLPQSKRGPDNEVEFEEIQERLRKLIEFIGASGLELEIYRTRYSENKDAATEIVDLEAHLFTSINLFELKLEDEPYYWHIYMSSLVNWNETASTVIKDIYDGVESNVFLIFSGKEILFHPYEGGVDIYMNDPKKMTQLKSHFQDWLSSREDGL